MSKSKRNRPTRTPGFARGKRVSDLMTREHVSFFDSSLAAERAGDAATALEYHRGVPMFTRSGHVVRLEQLTGLSEEMTPWMWARWAAYQCTRAEDPGTPIGRIHRSALNYTVNMFHTEEMEQLFATGGDPIQVFARTVGEDWVFHQVCTYALGGLRAFLETVPTGRLAEECGLARRWVGARMSGYRLEPTGPGELVVRDLAADRSLELLDLGARVHAGEGGWLVGRLVPSGTTPSLMFDTRPLPVDETTARAASTGDRRGAWITALTRAIDERRFDPDLLQSEDRELVTDVPSLGLVEVATAPAALSATLAQLADGRDEVGRAAFRVLRSAMQGTLGSDELAPYVAASVVNAHAWDEAGRQLVHPDHQSVCAHWADLVPDPARSRLTLLAERCRAAA